MLARGRPRAARATTATVTIPIACGATERTRPLVSSSEASRTPAVRGVQPRSKVTARNKPGRHEIQLSPRIVVRGKLGRVAINRA
jgi:hypothetical protein